MSTSTAEDVEAIWEEVICDSLADMNVFSGSKMWAEAAEHMGMTIPAVQKAVSEGKANQTRGSPEAEGKASREISDLFTLTYEYKWEVTTQDKKTFARSLANKTSGINDGDIKTIHIYCKDKVYTFVATGYMKGHIVLSENTDVIELRKNFFEEYYEENVNTNRTIAGLWAEPVPNQQGRQVDDVGIPSRRGGPIVDDLLSENPPSSNRKRNNERVWENTYSEEDAKQIVQQLKELYGIETTGKASRELDIAYLDAVKSGDMETAQKMVDEAAKILARTRTTKGRPYEDCS